MGRFMDTKALLERYAGRPLDIENLSTFEKWALDYFDKPEIIIDPTLEVTLELDITDANKTYRATYAPQAGASFSAYLTYQLFRTLKEHFSFNCRCIEGKWYVLENPPFVFPVATGSKERFSDVLIEDVHAMDWPGFCQKYREKVDNARNNDKPFDPVSDDIWYTAHFIGNLPNLRFTGMKLHRSAAKTGSPFFYFGERFEREGRLFTSLWINLDHRIADLHVLGNLIDDYKARLVE